ncbi:lytic polysaccharide monooxygenase [Pseudomonas abieticivorans]|uniref:lytic polysaccharide monooxygenase n=1 Tax=Pseudomonas abieticivorans TaxID=2931382 RepID=UPI0020C0FBB9|nr:lytic polysaccharide monooxygenase [Pseudomonas sp. PIA16]
MPTTYLRKGAGIAALVSLSALLLASQQAAAHGYISSPPSRDFACRGTPPLNSGCGAAADEPQSVGETTKGFPNSPIKDGELVSGGANNFAAMNIQSSSRWHQFEVQDRAIEFDWYFTTAHKATRFEYFITKVGWNPNVPLARASFDLAPFCKVELNGAMPAKDNGNLFEKHRCQLPGDRNGYHVIYGVWTVDDTPMAFHKAVDVNIQADGFDDGWKQLGALGPLRPLIAGDAVVARAFVGGVENDQYTVTLPILSAQDGVADNWSLALANKVNDQHPLVRAGVRDQQGNIEPIRGLNAFFAKPESGITSYATRFDLVGDPDAFARLENLQAEYELVKGQVDIDFSVATNRKLLVEVTVFDQDAKQVGKQSQVVDATTANLTVRVGSRPGLHNIKLVATSEDERINLQDLKTVQLTGEDSAYEHVFPQGLGTYKGATLVLQPKNGKVYECKSDQLASWCNSYNASATQYEPGIGFAWTQAWLER